MHKNRWKYTNDEHKKTGHIHLKYVDATTKVIIHTFIMDMNCEIRKLTVLPHFPTPKYSSNNRLEK